MPLTTPLEAVASYGDDADHFVHVLEHLFVPAVERAGYCAVRPVMSGADVIQAEIIRNLEQADLVLCDISRHNPNVFFELGVRTSLDRPVALVRDHVTDRLPFDTSIINTHTYDATLAPWKLPHEIDSLAAHVRRSAERSAGGNPLWRFFGLTKRADPEVAEGDPLQAKLDLIIDRVERFSMRPELSYDPQVKYNMQSLQQERITLWKVVEAAAAHGLEPYSVADDGDVPVITVRRMRPAVLSALNEIAEAGGLSVRFIVRP